MNALVFDHFGGPDVLQWRPMPDPVARDGHAVVRVRAAGVNFADIYRRNGTYHLSGEAPWILGYEGSGVVESLPASGASGFRVGDRVAFADSPFASAERVSVPIEKLIPVPDDVSDVVAAGLLLQGLTAQYLLRDSYTIRVGDVAVVWAAAGGVGLLLCQLATHAGARVIAVASSADKRAAAVQAGALAAFGYDDWKDGLRAIAPAGADVVYDSVGSTLAESLAAARVGGTVVFYGMADGNPAPVDPRMLMDRSLTLTGGDLWNVLTSSDIRRRRASALFDAVRSGQLSLRIAAEVPMQQGADAHRLLESRAVIGKVVLTL